MSNSTTSSNNTNKDHKPVALVMGATGQQGGHVVDELLEGDKFKVRAVTRNPTSPQASSLTSRGVEVVKGDLNDTESLKRALTGASSAFLVTEFSGAEGVAGEERRGKQFVDVAKETNLQHLVFSSVDGAERQSGVPHFDSKFAIEEHIRASGVPHTILRPVAFMENMSPRAGTASFFGLGFFAAGLGDKRLQLVSTRDIGWFAARAMERPGEYKGKAIALAGDDLNVEEMQGAYEKVVGYRPWRAWIPAAIMPWTGKEMSTMFKFFRERGYQADIPKLRSLHPGLVTFEQYLRNNQQQQQKK
eukprot:TRINITY_DN5421_c0_g1_i1.p1 TRINITY_DN5421_c0_g1~~TRINITY_DN5421_c0_g1_i1.p1  ORF type:complete len:318 (-),score=82.47 TRINITY_DN5421_c0_g1_i1:76-984(-)